MIRKKYDGVGINWIDISLQFENRKNIYTHKQLKHRIRELEHDV